MPPPGFPGGPGGPGRGNQQDQNNKQPEKKKFEVRSLPAFVFTHRFSQRPFES